MMSSMSSVQKMMLRRGVYPTTKLPIIHIRHCTLIQFHFSPSLQFKSSLATHLPKIHFWRQGLFQPINLMEDDEMEPSSSSDRGRTVANVDQERTLTTHKVIGMKVGGDVTIHGDANIQINLPTPPPTPPKTWFNVQNPVESFCGRRAVLAELLSSLQIEGLTVLSQLKIISGLGGVGKTQMVRQFILENKNSYQNIIWINAATSTTLHDAFLKLGDRLKLALLNSNGKPKPMDEIVQQVYTIVCEQKTLVIFDNADTPQDIKAFLPNALPPNQKIPFILATSRNQNWLNLSKNVMTLDVFTDNESVHFLLTHLNLPLDDLATQKGALILAKLLGKLPLALQQCVAFIREQNSKLKFTTTQFTMEDYVSLYETEMERRSLLNFPPFECDSEMTVLITWNVTFQKIQEDEFGPLAIQIIEVLSFLYADSIPVQLLRALFEDKREEEVMEGLVLLEKYSMITNLAGKKSISIHRQVQHVILVTMKDGFKASGWRIWDLINFLFSKLWPDKYDKFNCHFNILVPACSKFLDSVKTSDERYIDFLNCMNSLTDKFKLISTAAQLQFIYLEQNLGLKFNQIGYHNQAQCLLNKVLDIQRRHLGPQHLDTVQTEHYLGHVSSHKGDFETALVLFKNVLKIYQSNFKPEHPLLIKIESDLGKLSLDQGHYDEALSVLQKTVTMSLQIFGDHDPVTLEAEYNLSIVLLRKGKFEEAHELCQSIFEIQKKILGPAHPDTMKCQNVLGVILLDLGRFKEAWEMQRDLYEMRKKHLGEEHPETLKTLNNVADSLSELGEYDQALTLFEQVSDIYARISTPDNPLTLLNQNNIANMLSKLQRFDEAVLLFEKVLAKREQVLGKDHPATLYTLSNLARVLEQQGKFEEALRAEETVFEMRLKTLGKDHYRCKEAAQNVARIRLICPSN